MIKHAVARIVDIFLGSFITKYTTKFTAAKTSIENNNGSMKSLNPFKAANKLRKPDLMLQDNVISVNNTTLR